MLVYRIEHLDGWGPWHSSDHYGASTYTRNAQDGWRSCGSMPTPYEERGTPLGNHYNEAEWHYRDCRHAFHTLDKLLYYFGCPQGRAAMDADGYRCVVYDAADVLCGNEQCVFKHATAKPIQTVLLTELEQVLCSASEPVASGSSYLSSPITPATPPTAFTQRSLATKPYTVANSSASCSATSPAC